MSCGFPVACQDVVNADSEPTAMEVRSFRVPETEAGGGERVGEAGPVLTVDQTVGRQVEIAGHDDSVRRSPQSTVVPAPIRDAGVRSLSLSTPSFSFRRGGRIGM